MTIKNLKKLRKERGISQQELADVLGVSQQSVCKYENGQAEPDLDMIVNIADYFYTSVDYLIGHLDDQNVQTVDMLTDTEKHHISMFRRLSRASQLSINAIVSDILKK